MILVPRRTRLLCFAWLLCFACCAVLRAESRPVSLKRTEQRLTAPIRNLAIRLLIGELGTPRQELAVTALAWIGTPAITPLIDELSIDELSTDRAAGATEALVRIGPPAIAPLIQAMYRLPWISGVLGQMGAPAVRPLIRAFTKPYPWEVNEPCVALAAIGAPAVRPLLRLLHDPRYEWEVVTALGGTKDTRAVEPLIHVLPDQERFLNGDEVSEALVSIGSPALRRVFPLLHSRNRLIRYEAWKTIHVMGDNPTLLPALLEYQHSGDATYRLAALIGLSSVASRQEWISSDTTRLTAAELAINNQIRLGLQRGLHDPSPRVRLQALYACSDDRRFLPTLRRHLHDPNPWVRRAASANIGRDRVSR
ncbi:MAG TPA: hypothetical protein VFJ58_05150 [Armatimonadota bacterium]|nr:hypothetical protein [Armatimonadota bacterium]